MERRYIRSCDSCDRAHGSFRRLLPLGNGNATILGPSGREFELKSECEAILIPSLQQVELSDSTQVEKISGLSCLTEDEYII